MDHMFTKKNYCDVFFHLGLRLEQYRICAFTYRQSHSGKPHGGKMEISIQFESITDSYIRPICHVRHHNDIGRFHFVTSWLILRKKM